MDEIANSTMNSTFFAEAGPCNATNNITICPNEIDLFKSKILMNSDSKESKRMNLKINKCTGYSTCVTDPSALNSYFKDKLFIFKLESDGIDLESFSDPTIVELHTIGQYQLSPDNVVISNV